MYILIPDDVPTGIVPLVTAHASLSAYLRFVNDPDTIEWVTKSFKKVVVQVTREEFEESKQIERCVVITESSLDNKEVALVLMPRHVFPPQVKKYKLWK